MVPNPEEEAEPFYAPIFMVIKVVSSTNPQIKLYCPNMIHYDVNDFDFNPP